MFVLIQYFSPTRFPIIGPFKSADSAIKHVHSLGPQANSIDWRIQKINAPVVPKKTKPKKKTAKRKR